MSLFKRVIPVLFYKDSLLIRSKNFYLHQNIGNFLNQTNRFFDWDVDELIYINLGKNNIQKEKKQITSVIDKISQKCFLPLTFGGKIKSLEDATHFIRSGADKLVINTEIYINNKLITQISNKLGSQALVASIDYKIINDKPNLFINNGQDNTRTSIYEWIKKCEDLGVGEFFLHSIDRDGTGKGFDIKTINKVKKTTTLPVIACGGAFDQKDFLEVFKKTDITAAAAGNFFHFKENSYPNLKKFLKENNIKLR